MKKHRINPIIMGLKVMFIMLGSLKGMLLYADTISSKSCDRMFVTVEYLKPFFLHMGKKHNSLLTGQLHDILLCKNDRIKLSDFDIVFDNSADIIKHAGSLVKKRDDKKEWQIFFAALYNLSSIKRA